MMFSETDPIELKPVSKTASHSFPVLHQQRKQYIECLAIGPTAFNIVFTVWFKREDKKWIGSALDLLWQRHEILRTTYTYIDGEVFQQVHPGSYPAVDLTYTDLVTAEEKNRSLQDLIAEIAAIRSDLQNGPLVHVRWIDYDDQNSLLLFCIPHISADGHSVSIIKNEIELLSKALKEGTAVLLPPPRYQLRDYVEWIDQFRASEQGKRLMETYKRNVLESVAGETNLEIRWDDAYTARITAELDRRLNKARPEWYEKMFGSVIQMDPYPTGVYIVFLDELFLLRLNQLVLAFSCSLLIILFAAFSLLLGSVRNTNFIRICTPFSLKRSSDKWSSVIGWLSSEVIICQKLDPDQRIGDFLLAVTENIFAAEEYHIYPFEKLLHDLNFPNYLTAPVFLNMMRDKTSVIRDFSPSHQAGINAKFEFDCAIYECKNGIRFKTTYNTDAYAAGDIEGMFKKYFGLLNRLAACHKDDKLLSLMQ